MSDEQLRERLQRLLALARGTTHEGEQRNAEELLNRLLEENGLTLADIESEALEWHTFSYRGKLATEYARQLLTQTVVAVLNTTKVLHIRDTRAGNMRFKLTRAQALEVKLRYQTYARALTTDMDNLYSGFLHANGIFPTDTDEEVQKSRKELSPEELDALRRMMRAASTPVIPRAELL